MSELCTIAYLRSENVFSFRHHQQLVFKSGGLRHVGPCRSDVYRGRKFDTVDQLKHAIVQHRIMETSFAVCHGPKWRTQ